MQEWMLSHSLKVTLSSGASGLIYGQVLQQPLYIVNGNLRNYAARLLSDVISTKMCWLIGLKCKNVK